MGRRRRNTVYRTVAQRVKLWDSKLEPESFKVYLLAVKDLARELFAEYQAVQEYLISLVKKLTADYPEESIRQHAYMWYAQAVWYVINRYRERTRKLEVNALFIYWKALGLNEELLYKIACSLGECPDPVEKVISEQLGRNVGEITSEAVYEGVKKAIEETILPVEKDPDISTNPVKMEIYYDNNNNISKIVITDKVTNESRTINFTYDEDGNLIYIEEV